MEFKLIKRSLTGDSRLFELIDDPDYEIVKCSEQYFNELIVPEQRWLFPNSLCFKHRDRISFRGHAYIEDNEVILLTILACDPALRPSCKSKSQIG